METQGGRFQRRTNYYETDKMGIVHHSNYIRYFEEARLDWLEEMGLDYGKLEESGIMIPVMFAECQYLRPLHFGDEIEILVKLARFDGIKMEYSYELFLKATGTLCTTGRTGHCFLDGSMKPFRLKKRFPEIYRKMQMALERDGGTGKRDRGI